MFKEFGRKVVMFQNTIFKSAQLVQNEKRRQLYAVPGKRKVNLKPITIANLFEMAKVTMKTIFLDRLQKMCF